ncbi:MAG: iron-containing alcohol dehydrogenase [Paracoccus sp. (in: a-proteobacteria)]|nr:iron-containing alcohol dehydrogenase [Paracoccus sp. (in: a-proteobacteria)]
MLPAFSFAAPARILFGRGQAASLPQDIRAMAGRVMLIHGRNPARIKGLADALAAAGGEITRFSVPAEPDLPLIETALAQARASRPDLVLAIGGGAVIDAGKAIAALAPATRPVMDHLEVVGRGLPLDQPPLPFVAVPTTAGTGAEVTRNAVLSVPEYRRKVSLRDARMLPRLALIDPALTDGCPWPVTLASGLDAVTQVVEPFLCTAANPLTDALCADAIPRGLAALTRLAGTEDPAARDEMAWVSLCGGLALANAGLGVVHGLAGPLGGLSGAAHGAICGALLPHALIANDRAMARDGRMRARMDSVARWIGAAFGAPGATLPEAARLLADWSRGAGLSGLDGLGITADDRRSAALAAAGSSSMRANPVPLTPADLETLMEEAR